MGLGLNLEGVVEGDEEEFNDFLNLMENVHQQMQQPKLQGEQEADIIDLNAPASLGYISTPESVISSPRLPDDLEALDEVPLVLELQAPPMNFSIEEIQQHELMFASESPGQENG
jgi:hypothetical protein